MTLEEFIKEFLPNFDERWECTSSELKQTSSIELIRMGFNVIHFEEALQNFTNKICNKQRKVCANDAKCKFNNDVFSSRSTSIYSIMDAILNAEQPKIEDL